MIFFELTALTNQQNKLIVTTKKASFWKRLIAFYIDATLVIIFCALLGLILNLSDTLQYWLDVGLFYSYMILMDYYHQATLGKMILKLRVIKVDGSKPDFLSSFYRNFGKIISALPFGYGFLRILAPHQRQTIHDELGKCLVIELNKAK